MNPLWIGNVTSVTGNKVEIRLRDEIKNMYMSHEGQLFRIGQIGTYLIIKSGYDKLVGLVSQVKLQEIAFERSSQSGKDFVIGEKKVMEINLIGTIKSGMFFRGIDVFPLIGDEVYLTSNEEIDVIFAQSQVSPVIALGKFSQNKDIDVYVDVNKFLSRHFAILGSTGSGKSTTVASIVSLLAEKYEYPHILIFDVHGEYAGAKELADKPWCNIINSTSLKIPYWMLTYDDWLTILNLNSENAFKQASALKKTLIEMRKNAITPEKQGLYRERVDIPLFYNLDDFVAKYKGNGDAGSSAQRLEGFVEDVRNEFITKPEPFITSESLKDYIEMFIAKEQGKKVTVVDLSELPSDLLTLSIAIVSRVLFDFAYWNLERDYPLLFIYEESHKYLSQQVHPWAARKTVEKIAKEGRKYGVSVAICSQRPSEISDTILAQCNNFISHRLTTDVDQKIVRMQLSDNLSGVTNLLPILGRGEAVIVGDSVVVPARINITKKIELKNVDCDFDKLWSEGPNDDFDVEFVLENIRAQAFKKRKRKIKTESP